MAFHNLLTDLAEVASSRQLIKSHRQVYSAIAQTPRPSHNIILCFTQNYVAPVRPSRDSLTRKAVFCRLGLFGGLKGKLKNVAYFAVKVPATIYFIILLW